MDLMHNIFVRSNALCWIKENQDGSDLVLGLPSVSLPITTLGNFGCSWRGGFAGSEQAASEPVKNNAKCVVEMSGKSEGYQSRSARSQWLKVRLEPLYFIGPVTEVQGGSVYPHDPGENLESPQTCIYASGDRGLDLRIFSWLSCLAMTAPPKSFAKLISKGFSKLCSKCSF